MITCPNCGSLVRESQRFCGSCGTDVSAASTVGASAGSAGEEQSSPYAYQSQGGYGQSSSSYGAGQSSYGGYEPLGTQPPVGGRLMIIAGALILAICCAFACGLIFGFELIPDLLGMGGASAVPPPRPTTAPTPTGLLPILHYVMSYL